MSNGCKPTAFDLLRYAYLGSAYGNLLKAIRGGTSPVGVMTLALCMVASLSEIQWCIENQAHLLANGELPEKRQLKKLGYLDRELFESWLQRWVCDSGINANCNPARVYGLRSALVHTTGASESLKNAGVKAWLISTTGDTVHYGENILRNTEEPRFTIEMPEFLAELFFAAVKFLEDNKNTLSQEDTPLRGRVGFLCLPTSYDSTQLVNNQSNLAWFDAKLGQMPVGMTQSELAAKIRNYYQNASAKGLVTQ